jgi:hypothetical protein
MLLCGSSVLGFAVVQILSQPGWNEEWLQGLAVALPLVSLGVLCLGSALQFATQRLWLRPHLPDETLPPREPETAYRTGTTWAIALERDRPTASGALVLVGTALYWNIPLAVLWVGFAELARANNPSWALLVFIILYSLFGCFLIGFAVYALLEEFPVLKGVKETRVEVSDLPLRPGKSYRVAVCQPGPLRLRTLEIHLICEMDVPSRDADGDPCTKIETVRRDEVLREEEVVIEDGMPYTSCRPLAVPAEAKSSSKKEGSKVAWKILVRGRFAGWRPGFTFAFPVTVAGQPP